MGADAERQAEELIHRWLQWLQCQTSDLPTVCRFDIMAKRMGPGRAAVTTGELTELGGCFLGWPQGPKTVQAAMLRSCFKPSYATDVADQAIPIVCYWMRGEFSIFNMLHRRLVARRADS